MSARDDYPHRRVDLVERLRQMMENSTDELREHSSVLEAADEIEAAREVLRRARSYAHACGLFQGGHQMDTYVAIYELLVDKTAEQDTMRGLLQKMLGPEPADWWRDYLSVESGPGGATLGLEISWMKLTPAELELVTDIKEGS